MEYRYDSKEDITAHIIHSYVDKCRDLKPGERLEIMDHDETTVKKGLMANNVCNILKNTYDIDTEIIEEKDEKIEDSQNENGYDLKRIFIERKKDFGLERVRKAVTLQEYAETLKEMTDAIKINDALIDMGMTKEEFAKFMGIDKDEVDYWLSGTHNFTKEELEKINAALRQEEMPEDIAKVIDENYFDIL